MRERGNPQRKKNKNMTKGGLMVKCERCAGFMVKDSIYNVEDQFLELEVGRCLNCGHTVDLTLLKINPKKAEKERYEKQVTFHSIPITG